MKHSKKTTWNVKEVNKFLSEIKYRSFGISYVLAIFTGMRRGEILALKWDDIDFQNRKIHIRHSLAYVPKKGLLIKEPKTSKSKRKISISNHVTNELKEHKERQYFHLEKMGYINERNLVVTSENRKPVNPRNLLRQFLT